jgi:hypothetical protein
LNVGRPGQPVDDMSEIANGNLLPNAEMHSRLTPPFSQPAR